MSDVHAGANFHDYHQSQIIDSSSIKWRAKTKTTLGQEILYKEVQTLSANASHIHNNTTLCFHNILTELVF